MTHNILLADIDYARRQMKDSVPDAAIIAGLICRGIDSAKAAQLLDDLRNGRKVTPDLQLALRSRRRKRSLPDEAPPVEQNEAAAPQTKTQDQNHVRVRREETGLALKTRLIGGALVFAALCLAGLALYHYRFSPEAQDERAPAPTNASPPAIVSPKPQLPAPKASPGPQPPAPAPASSLELQPDGLHLGGTLLTRQTARAALSRLLGPPTRTNRLEQSNKVVYAFDHHGILLYAQEGGDDDYVVLDFDGTSGTEAPFAGSLDVETHQIQAATDSATLEAIQPLRLKHPEGDTGFLRGQYGNLELYFAYLKSPKRLSLAQIVLK